jgi:dihydrodipicolinate synthase/N-acetylneuraminate lyase
MKFEGVFPVVPTPLFDDEQIDHKGLQHLIDYYVTSGCHGLVVMGSGGEFPYITLEERGVLFASAAGADAGGVPLVSGCGFYSLQETLAFLRACEGLALDGLLVALPTYFPLKFEDVFAYYKEIARHAPCPILYYHFPQMTGLFFNPEQLGQILRIDGITGMKVSAFCLKEMRQLLEQVPAGKFSLFAGVGFLLRHTIEMGGCGVIDPVASFAPHLVVEAYNACRNGERELSRQLQEKILDMIPVVNSFSLPAFVQKRGFKLMSQMPKPSRTSGRAARHAVIKEVIRQLGHPVTSRVHTPLPQLTDKEREQVRAFIAGNPDLTSASYR